MKKIRLFYHYIQSILASIWYGFPSKKMMVIGVTGTKGKTSTMNFIWSTLMAGGLKTGIVSTANIRMGADESMNIYHMTMPGPWVLQKLMAQMVKKGCTHAIIETTSEGIKQHRHIGIAYDIAVFTNLTPEHLQSHEGSFDLYKQMKGKLFQALTRHPKKIQGKPVEKIILVNADSEHAAYFLQFAADKKMTFGLERGAEVTANTIVETHDGVRFMVDTTEFFLGILGKFNVLNALPAIMIAREFGIPDVAIQEGLKKLLIIPGRMEIMQHEPFLVIVDYAHEKQSMTHVLETARAMKKPGTKTIVLLGAEGGGRDVAKRALMGEIAARLAEIVIVSNVDPYEDNPTQIAEGIAVAAEQHGKVRNKDLFVIEDRRAGIQKCLALATAGDIVLITGKGAEQSITIGGVKYPWDDRDVVREELTAPRNNIV